nr:hypothetical protein [Tanacetum cinerariifolium]
MKWIKREYRNARTPYENRVAERKNKILIEAARTMLADSLLPITFWAKAVNTACYVLNRDFVTKPHNKTPYELLNGRSPRLAFMRPFGYLVTVLNTLDSLGKFKGNQTNKNAGLQDINGNVGTQDNVDAGKEVSDQHHIMLQLWSSISSTYKSSDDKDVDDKPTDDNGSKTIVKPVNMEDQAYKDALDRQMSQEKEASDVLDSLCKEFEQGCMDKKGVAKAGSTNSVNTVSTLVNVASTSRTFSAGGPSSPHPDTFISNDTLLHVDQDDSQIPNLEDTTELRSVEADFNNMESSTIVSLIPTYRVHIDNPKDQILGDPKSAVQIRGMEKKSSGAHAFVYKNKKDERGIVVRNKSRLVAQGHRQEERIDYDKVFAPVARIEVIRIFLVFASFMGFTVYQIDVKSAFLYGKIEKEVYVSQPLGFIDPFFPNKVYKVEKALYGLHQAPRAWSSSVKKESSLVRIICACSRFQVTPKLSHLHAVKWIFRYLKSQPKLGLQYPRDSPFNLEAYLDSDYAGANLDTISTTRGCKYLGRRLISWQCKKQTIVATSTIKAGYDAAAK